MKKILLMTFLVLSFQSCSSFKGNRKTSSDEKLLYVDSKYKEDITRLESLIEKSLVWRENSMKYYQANHEKFTRKEHLSHKEMETIFQWGKDYLDIRNELIELANKYKIGIGYNAKAELNPGKGTKIEEYNRPEDDDFTDGGQFKSYKYKIDLQDEAGQELAFKIKISIATASVLYDNYMVGIFPYEKSWKIRRLINVDSEELKNQLEKITYSFFRLQNRIEYFKTARFYKKLKSYQEENKISIFKDENYFDSLVEGSPIFHFMTSGKDLQDQPMVWRAFTDKVFDTGRFLNDSFSYYSSMIFGNTMGLFASRKGKLFHLPVEEKNQIVGQLKPLDILLEKTPFRLTDKFIPGHYGHVAIWVGSEDELKQLGIWDHPIIKKYQNDIRNGKRIIEALRPGVEINTLDHFLNIDDLLVLRDNDLGQEEKIDFLERAFSQIGKAYDFNFDVETDKKIVCSEIVYVVFHNIDWPTKKALGRFTISPDNVAGKAVKSGPLHPVLMYQDGIKIDSDKMQQLLESNLNEE